MSIPSTRRLLAACLAVAAAGMAFSGNASAAQPTVSRALAPDTRFYVDPDSEALHQALADLKAHNLTDAAAMAKLATWPEAAWFTSGTPAEVKTKVSTLVRKAKLQHAVPVLVAYFVPLRDCSQYSAGGAQSDADYQAWISAFAAGLGTSQAVVILEPDGLALLPKDCGQDPTGEISAARIADIKYAVGALEAQPGANVYLDSGNSQWHSTGDAAQRLIDAGVADAQGFVLNVSNYQPTDETTEYGTWISKCIALATGTVPGAEWMAGHADWCASQYYSNKGPVSPADSSTWHFTDEWFADFPGLASVPLTHFVIDTSRNGKGAWKPVAAYPDAQVWCNAPNRGIGLRPTADTGVALVDAYLWVKTIGESDGQCNRGISGGTIDPEYGIVDPAAGAWWPDLAHTLARNATPALGFNF